MHRVKTSSGSSWQSQIYHAFFFPEALRDLGSTKETKFHPHQCQMRCPRMIGCKLHCRLRQSIGKHLQTSNLYFLAGCLAFALGFFAAVFAAAAFLLAGVSASAKSALAPGLGFGATFVLGWLGWLFAFGLHLKTVLRKQVNCVRKTKCLKRKKKLVRTVLRMKLHTIINGEGFDGPKPWRASEPQWLNFKFAIA